MSAGAGHVAGAVPLTHYRCAACNYEFPVEEAHKEAVAGLRGLVEMCPKPCCHSEDIFNRDETEEWERGAQEIEDSKQRKRSLEDSGYYDD